MNTIPKLIAFNLSTLSTMMLCVSVQTWASDIEIYQAAKPGDGKASVMLVLDNSSVMHQSPNSSGGGKPINYDFGTICPSEKTTELSETFNFTGTDNTTYSHAYKSYYCDVSVGSLTANNVKADKIRQVCNPIRDSANAITGYRCFDRFSMLKKSLFNTIASLGSNVSIGLTYFPPLKNTNGTALPPVAPLPLTDANKNTLMTTIASVPPSEVNQQDKQAPIAQGYGAGAKALIEPVVGKVDQCSGYGVYTLTGGTPLQDDLIKARTDVQSILKDTAKSLLTTSDCPDTSGSGTSASSGVSWGCVAKSAHLLASEFSKISVPVKSAVVGFGAEFAFTGFPVYAPNLTPAVIKQAAEKLYSKNASEKPLILDEQNAAITGIYGQGGYYAASSGDEITESVRKFVTLVGDAKIPPLTTGTVTIPQDPLNTSVVRDQAYYPQFKPTPDHLYQLWAGNVKKYKVTTQGQLVDKKGTFVFNSAGLLVDNHDFWSPDVNLTLPDDEPETTPGSLLFALMGGAKSKLALRTAADTTVVNRTLLTNRQVDSSGVSSESTTLKKIDLNYLTTADPNRGYLISLLGYQVDATQPQNITTDSLKVAPELRQIGAVMHSSPLLFTNKGKIDYSGDALIADNREDYVLFGTTQGLLHVVKAGGKPTVTVTENPDGTKVTTETPDPEGGKEVFAFVPNEMVNKQKEAFLKPSATSGGLNRLFYGIDAPWTAYTQYVLDNDGNLTVGVGRNFNKDTNPTDVGKQLLYGGLRMGGRSYYSLNLQDVTKPQINFHIDPASKKVYANGSSKTFDELGFMAQSWSKPKVAWVKWQGQRKLVMFVGGGYDAGGVDGDAHDINGNRIDYAGYENDSYNQTNGKGAGVYMFDALNGDLLWWASNNAQATSALDADSGVIAFKDSNLKYSVASEIKTADRDNDGLVDHLYFGDLAGQVFRIDLNNAAAKIGSFAKRSVRLLNLHHLDANGVSDGKSPRFYDAPAFSTYKNSNGALFAVISIGSGNRSRPLVTYPLDAAGRDYDAIYNIYDKDVISKTLYTATTMTTQDIGVSGSTNALVELTDTDRFNISTIKAPYGTPGWYYKFKSGNLFQSEKVMGIPIVIDSDLYVSTYDQSKLGFTGACGGGVKGASALTAFCMPYGQCSSGSVETYALNLGVGIVGAAVGAGDAAGLSRLLVPNVDTSALVNATNNKILSSEYKTRIRLTPQRWYER